MKVITDYFNIPMGVSAIRSLSCKRGPRFPLFLTFYYIFFFSFNIFLSFSFFPFLHSHPMEYPRRRKPVNAIGKAKDPRQLYPKNILLFFIIIFR